MKFAACIIVLLLSSLILFSCKNENSLITTTEEQPKINLVLEDVSCTEAWLKLKTENVSLPADVDLFKDRSLYEKIKLASKDTVLYVDSLLPDHSYSFHSINHSSNHSITSDPLPVTTMDTTSHNFTWQTWTFGEQAGSCVLYDVVIINENDIWAVGEIYLLDSTGVPDPNAYNAVHWDGNQWELKRLRFYGSCSAVEFPPLRAVWAFSDTEIIVTNGAGIGLFDGNTITLNCGLNHLLTGGINKIWGINTNDLYVVGNNGNIAHYQNGHWSKIESGTDLNINDIYGAYDKQTDQYEILAPASDVFHGLDRDLLSINAASVRHINTEQISGTLRTAWFITGRTYLLGGGGIFRKVSLIDSLWVNKDDGVTNYSTNRIRGDALNNIAITGGCGEVLHFNGYNFKSFFNQTYINGNYYSVDIKNNIIVVVGEDNPKAAITMGKRTH